MIVFCPTWLGAAASPVYPEEIDMLQSWVMQLEQRVQSVEGAIKAAREQGRVLGVAESARRLRDVAAMIASSDGERAARMRADADIVATMVGQAIGQPPIPEAPDTSVQDQ